MTTPLTDQIRDYFADVEARQGSFDAGALLESESSRPRTVDDPSTPTTLTSPRWWVGLIAAAAIVVLVAGLVIIRSVADDRTDDLVPTVDDGRSPFTSDGSPESVPATDPAQPIVTTTSTPEPAVTTTTVPPGWSGAIREPSDVDQPMVVSEQPDGSMKFTWQDPPDAPTGWVDVERVLFDASLGFGDDGEVIEGATQPYWRLELAAKPPLITELEPGLVIAYGLVLETTGDGVADYLVGIDNEAPNPGDFRVWLTDLAAGDTDLKIGPSYGWPIEFMHPDEQQPGEFSPDGKPVMLFTFLDGGPADLDFEDMRFYAWTSVTRGDVVIANDFAPDEGWITADSRTLWGAQGLPE